MNVLILAQNLKFQVILEKTKIRELNAKSVFVKINVRFWRTFKIKYRRYLLDSFTGCLY